MDSQIALGLCRFELLCDEREFHGIGRVWIGDTLLRSGRLPWRADTQSFTGYDLQRLELLEVRQEREEVRIRLRAHFAPLKVKLMRDHSFDPIHETGDWDAPDSAAGELTLVLTPACDTLGGERFTGFAYHYEYAGETVPLFYLYDMASWELDGDITGATAISQSSCSAPCVTFSPETAWSTEGLLHFLLEEGGANAVMTHNIPRWVGHQCFDFQCREDKTLLGVFARVDLIRSVLRRDAGKAELKTFDKYIFDQSLAPCTPAKAILLNTGTRTLTGQKNLWTWILDELHERARAEFGLREEPLRPKIRNEYWEHWDYRRKQADALAAAVNLGVDGLFSHDNLLKSAWSEGGPLQGTFTWNVCCGHEYEPIEQFGGAEGLTELVRAAREQGVRLWCWTNNDQALSSPLNRCEREDGRGWYVLLEDTRQKYGGAYAGCMSVLDFNTPQAAQYFIDAHNAVKEATGLDAWWFDSFYNLAFMPVNYRDCRPHTMWRALLQAMKTLQQAGHTFMIETFGPFGEPACGAHSSYGHAENLFACYKMTVNPGYSVIPTSAEIPVIDAAQSLYRFLAHMACPQINLYEGGRRIDAVWTDAHRRALADYKHCRAAMHRRFLLEDGSGVRWLDRDTSIETLWNFAPRKLTAPGPVHDITAGKILPASASYMLEAYHTYQYRLEKADE